MFIVAENTGSVNIQNYKHTWWEIIFQNDRGVQRYVIEFYEVLCGFEPTPQTLNTCLDLFVAAIG